MSISSTHIDLTDSLPWKRLFVPSTTLSNKEWHSTGVPQNGVSDNSLAVCPIAIAACVLARNTTC